MRSTVLALLVLVFAAGCGEQAPAPESTGSDGAEATVETVPEPAAATALPRINYYELSETCPFCIRIRADIAALEKEYAGRVEFQVMPCRGEEGIAAKDRNGWKEYIHGLEAIAPDGTVVGQIEGHEFKRVDLEAQVEALLKASKR